MIARASELKLTYPSDREIEFTRILDASRELVFKTMMDPNLIPRWWGPRRYTTLVDRMDVRVGGRWRFANRAEDGTEFWFNGEYREIVPPARLVSTFEFEGMPGHIGVDTTSFEDLGDGRTLLRVRSVFPSKEDRDLVLGTGMESGARETYDRLAEVLAERTRVGSKG